MISPPKHRIIAQIVAQLGEERELLDRAARAAHFEATDEQSKAENKYDTRGLEASYLARGQAQKVKEVELAIEQFHALPSDTADPTSPVQLGSLVQLKSPKGKALYFVGPRAGGMEVEADEHEICVITPQSPLGQQLMGQKRGARLRLDLGGTRQEFEVAGVW